MEEIMTELLSKKAVGFYFTAVAAIAAVISIIRFSIWASSSNNMDAVILAALIVGLLIDIVLIFKDSDYLIILTTVFYSIAVFKLLVNSVGSFVDAFQGINMFGDATQVSTIISISIVMLVSVILSIIASFLKRIKD